MAGGVAVGRRNLFEDRRRAALALAGIGAGLLMVLLMTGVFVGMTKQETAYIDASPADVFVSQDGVRTLQMSSSVLPADTVDRARTVPGVAWAEPLRYESNIVTTGPTTLIAYVFGYDTRSGRGGPQNLVEGHAPGPGEVVLDTVGAKTLHTAVGQTIKVFDTQLRVAGLASGLSGMGNTVMFVSLDQFAAMKGPGVNRVLVGGDGHVDAAELAARVTRAVPHVTAQSRAQFSAQQAAAVADLYTDVVRTMIGVGFLIALALVALTLSTVTTAKLREYGVIKALGGTNAHITGVVLRQALWAVSTAMALAAVAAVALARLLAVVLPNIELVVEPGAVAVTAVGAIVVGLPAAVMPLRRALRVDPATAFRSGG